jgi:hypothetical protein
MARRTSGAAAGALARTLPDDKQAKFKALGIKRVNKALADLRLIKKLSNRTLYAYSDHDVQKIISALQNEIEELQNAFTPSATKSKDRFTF